MTTSYVYVRSEPQLWTVGYYRPDGAWQPQSDHGSEAEAVARVHYLNGGCGVACAQQSEREERLHDRSRLLALLEQTLAQRVVEWRAEAAMPSNADVADVLKECAKELDDLLHGDPPDDPIGYERRHRK